MIKRKRVLKAVIFDMDGVMVDSEHQWKLAGKPFFRKLIPDWREEFYDDVVGLGVADLYDFLRNNHGLKASKERFFAFCDQIADEVYNRRVTRTEGLLELLTDLKKHRVRIGLASSSPRKWIRMVLDRFRLHKSFHCVVSVDDVGGKGKPKPDIYLKAARRLGAAPETCVAVEDSAFGVAAAKKAGLACIGFRNGSNPEQNMSSADLEVRRLRELNYGRINRLIR